MPYSPKKAEYKEFFKIQYIPNSKGSGGATKYPKS